MDNILLLPVGEEVNILVMAADVLHSFVMPSTYAELRISYVKSGLPFKDLSTNILL